MKDKEELRTVFWEKHSFILICCALKKKGVFNVIMKTLLIENQFNIELAILKSLKNQNLISENELLKAEQELKNLYREKKQVA